LGSRDSINEIITLADCKTPKDRTGKTAHFGKFVATINSFHYTNANQNTKSPVISPTHLICQIKLMSTAFVSTSPDAKNVNPDWRGPPMMFDKNGLMLPFDCMMSLLESPVFQQFVNTAGERYTRYKAEQAEMATRRAVVDKAKHGEGEDEEEEDEEEEEPERDDDNGSPAKKKKLISRKSVTYPADSMAMTDEVTIFTN
jgi:hypothetical protein